jgi:type IV pilus assembly protein PilA
VEIVACPRCGKANATGAKFCGECGAELPAEIPTPQAVAPSVLGLGLAAPAPRATAAPLISSAAENSGKAIASLVCGLFFLVFPAAVGAIILGHVSLSEIAHSAGRLKGRGMAIAGLVLGYSGVFVIPIVAIVAALAIPNLLRARMAANEASAVASLRTIGTATTFYAATYRNGFAPDMASLDGAAQGQAGCDHAQLIDGALGSGRKDGYEFSYISAADPAVAAAAAAHGPAKGCSRSGVPLFEVHADPIERGTTGQRSFYTDQTGIIRWSVSGPATAQSPTLE